jgi:hypothetical protein
MKHRFCGIGLDTLKTCVYYEETQQK